MTRLVAIFVLFATGFALGEPTLVRSFSELPSKMVHQPALLAQTLWSSLYGELGRTIESLPRSLGERAGEKARSTQENVVRSVQNVVVPSEKFAPPPTLNVPAEPSQPVGGPESGISSGFMISPPVSSLQPPVSGVERVIERVVSALPAEAVAKVGISSSDLESLRNELNNRISSETNLLRALIAERGDSNFRAIALTNKIDHLSGITLSSITISSVSGLTDADIPNDITIASSAGLSATTGSFSSTFGVTGLSTFTGGFLSQASSTVASNLNVGGPLSASSTLSVAEAASLLSTLSVSSLSTLAGFISTASSSVSAGLQVAGAFNASSTSFFNGLLTFGNATGTQLTTTGSTYLATTGGNVGIGTTSPFRKFSVKSTESNPQFALSYDDSTFSDFQIDSTGDLIFNPSGDDVFLNDDNLWVCSGGACSAGTPAGTGNLIVETRLGIGTSTPNWALQLAGTRPFLTLSDTSAGTDLKHWFFSSQGGNLYVGTTTDGYATTTGYQFLTMTNTGRLGIGTTSPYAPFSLHTTANSVPMFAIGSTSPTGGFNTVFDITSYGTTTVPAGSLITTSRPCANNYVRVGLWCMATTTVLLRANAASDESAWTTNTVNSAATRLVMLKFVARAIDGTNSFSIQNCGVPADYTGPDCSALGIGDFGQGAIAEGSAAGRASHYNTEILKTDNLGQVKTWCEVTTAADTTTCGWTIMGYME